MSKSLEIGIDGAHAVIDYHISGADLWSFITERFTLVTYANSGYAIRGRQRHPDYNWMLLKGLAAEPMVGGPAASDSYDDNTMPKEMRVRATYEGPSIGIQFPNAPGYQSGTILEWATEDSCEMITLQNEKLKWESDGTALSDYADVGRLIVTRTHTLTWSNVRYPPWAAIARCRGTVNRYTFCGADPETLLFVSDTSSRTYDQDGASLWSLGYTFIEKSIRQIIDDEVYIYGHNHDFRGDSDDGATPRQWDKPIDEQGRTKFSASDFKPLFFFE